MIPFSDSTGMIYMHWVPTGLTVNKEYYVEVLREFRKRFLGNKPALFKSVQWHFHQDNAPVHNPILVTDNLTKMGVKTVPHPPYSQDLAPWDFWLFPKLKETLRGCRYETIEEYKEAVTKVIDTLTQDFNGTFQKLLERYKCIAAGGDYFEGGLEFHVCTINKSAHTKKVRKLIVRSSYLSSSSHAASVDFPDSLSLSLSLSVSLSLIQQSGHNFQTTSCICIEL